MLVLVLGFFLVHPVSVSQNSAGHGSVTTGNPFFLILIILLPLVGALIGLVLLSVSLTAFRYREKWFFWFLAIYSWPLLFFFPIGTGFGLFFLIYCLSRREEFLGGATVRTEAAKRGFAKGAASVILLIVTLGVLILIQKHQLDLRAEAERRRSMEVKAAPLDAADMQFLADQVGAGGKFLGRDAPHIDQEAGYACVYVPCRWEGSQHDIKLVFDADGQLGGM
jgi:hypothetical protein